MIQKGRIFILLLLILLCAVSKATTSNRLETSAERAKKAEEELKDGESLGLLSSETSKNLHLNVNKNINKSNVSDIKVKELESTKKLKESKFNSKKQPSKTTNPTLAINNSSLSSPTDWAPILNKTTTNESIARIKKEKKEAENLVNNLMLLNYNNYTPPKELYNTSIDPKNKHLPYVYLKSDYFNMAFKAIEKDDIDGLRAIITVDSNFINKQDNNGDTLLIFAIKNNKLNCARILLAKGANPNIQNNQQRSAMYYAVSLGNSVSENLLLSMGARVDLIDKKTTAVDYAKLEKQQNVVHTLNKYIEQQQ